MKSKPKIMHSRYFLVESTAVLLKSSIVITFLLIFIQIVSASTTSNKFEKNLHKTKEASEVKPELYCFACDYLHDSDNCVNINKTRQLNLTKRCENDQNFCVVKRFSYTTSDKNSTSEKKLWSLQRDCTNSCESGCIIIGERVKLYACSSCCQNNLCNVNNLCNRHRDSIMLPIVIFLFFCHQFS